MYFLITKAIHDVTEINTMLKSKILYLEIDQMWKPIISSLA